MNKYYYLYLIWLLPAYFLVMGSYQFLVHQSIHQTYDSGESYIADVIDFDIKQIAAQTNGYVILSFVTVENETIQRKLSLPVQMAQIIMESDRIPVRYQPESFNQIVIIPTYELQRHVLQLNLIVSLFGLGVTIFIAVIASRFAKRRLREGEETVVIERTDTDNTD